MSRYVPPGPETRTSLREYVAGALRASLISGQMQAGDTYSVPGLAERFGVSATPVREAMLDLVRQGMVVAVPNKGFRVVEVTDSELDEITELRLLLEVPTVGGLTGGLGPTRLEQLRALADQVYRHAADGNLIDYIEVDHRFHLYLLGLAGNRRLVEVVKDLRARTRLYGLGGLVAEGSLTRSAAEHHDLLGALAAGTSRAEVEALIARHIRHVRGIWVGRSEPDEPVRTLRECDGGERAPGTSTSGRDGSGRVTSGDGAVGVSG